MESKLPEALQSVADTLGPLLEPLSVGGRARVLLSLILQYAPKTFSDEELTALQQQAKKP